MAVRNVSMTGIRSVVPACLTASAHSQAPS